MKDYGFYNHVQKIILLSFLLTDFNSPKYRSKLEISGNQNDISLVMLSLDNSVKPFKPNDYFNIIYINAEPYLQLKKAIDRDVSNFFQTIVNININIRVFVGVKDKTKFLKE